MGSNAAVSWRLRTPTDRRREEFNASDWRIEKEHLPRIALFVQLINSLGFVLTPLGFLVVDVLWVRPALRRSLRRMKAAEDSGWLSLILCDAGARRDMEARVATFRDDLRRSPSLTCFAKVTNLVAVGRCLRCHEGLLSLGVEVEAEERPAVVFVCSLPRTGSTALHHALAADRSRFRSLDFADQVLPAPPLARCDARGRAALAKRADRLLSALDVPYPGWRACVTAAHELRADAANEDHVWYNSGLGVPFVAVGMLTPAESRRRENPTDRSVPLFDRAAARYKYAWLDMVLRVYQSVEPLDSPARSLPWILKDPRHANHLEELLDAFPDARLVTTHRSIRALLPSCCDLIVRNQNAHVIPGAPGTDAAFWGREVAIRTGVLCDALLEFTRRREGTDLGLGGARRVDATFTEFANDPEAVAERVRAMVRGECNAATTTATSSTGSSSSSSSSKSKGRRNKKRTPTLEDYGLTEDDMVRFEEYDRFFRCG